MNTFVCSGNNLLISFNDLHFAATKEALHALSHLGSSYVCISRTICVSPKTWLHNKNAKHFHLQAVRAAGIIRTQEFNILKKTKKYRAILACVWLHVDTLTYYRNGKSTYHARTPLRMSPICTGQNSICAFDWKCEGGGRPTDTREQQNTFFGFLLQRIFRGRRIVCVE